MRYLFLIFVITFLFSCRSQEEQIVSVIKDICKVNKVEVVRSQQDTITYLSFNIYGADLEKMSDMAAEMHLQMIQRVKGFCEMDEKIVIQFVEEKGLQTKYHPYVYRHCQWLFEF